MKKIAIISFQNESNYGALLQAFALQFFCRQLGYSAYHIDYVSKFYFASPYVKSEKKLPLFVIRLYRWIRSFIISIQNRNNTNAKTINRSFAVLRKISYKESKNFDVYIAGSDQIWNPNFIWGREKKYFLGFGNKSAKRISYAASLGAKEWPVKFKKIVEPYLNRFDKISVREESAVLYLKSLGYSNVDCVCDPTILHNASFYLDEFKIKKEPCSGTFVYTIWVSPPTFVYDMENPFFVKLRDPQNNMLVEEWLRRIINAKYVVTDSFHCAVFSVLFHKPFVILANNGSGKGMNERFQTLLGKTELLYRVLPQGVTEEVVTERLNRSINWEKIDSIMEEWRTNSAIWLKDALEN